MARKYKAKVDTPHGQRTCFEASVERAGRKPLVARFGGIPLKRQKKAVLDDRPAVPATTRKELVTRLHAGPVRMVRAARGRGGPPGPQARRPHQAGTPAARVGKTHGQNAQEDAHRLRPLPPGHPRGHPYRCHGIVTGEPRAPETVPAWFGPGAGGKGPAARQAPRRRPTGVAAELEQHAGQRAAGDAAQRGPQDRGNRRAGRADQPGQGRDGGARARHDRLASAFPGPAGVYTESQ